jgi:acyl dehydratase
MSGRFFEDLSVGDRDAFGAYRVTREETVAFARAYDPQPFHLDDAAAAANPIFGRLSASGWNTAAIAMRLLVDRWQEIGLASIGGGGVDGLRWTRPVYPGDTLRIEAHVLALKPSASRPEMGAATSEITMFNQDAVMVMKFTTTGFILRRHPG